MSNWIVQLDKLDPTQKEFIYDKNQNNIWIKGFAGSGKSVLLAHRINDEIIKNQSLRIAIVVFTHSLIEMFRAGLQELKTPTNKIEILTYYQFSKNHTRYDFIVCDEVQDLPISIIQNMRNKTDKLILAGDENQSIYEYDPSTREPTITDFQYLNTILKDNPIQLMNNHRLTKDIVKIISKLIPSMNILSSIPNRVKHSSTVRLGNAESLNDEVEYIIEEANQAIEIDESVAILFYTQNNIIEFINRYLSLQNINPWIIVKNRYNKIDFHSLNNYLNSVNIKFEYIGNSYGNLYQAHQQGKIIFMTYHSAKGLDFDNVFLPFLNQYEYFNSYFNTTLLMVGMTRSKQNLTLSYTGQSVPEIISSIIDDVTKIDISNQDNAEDNSDDDMFDF